MKKKVIKIIGLIIFVVIVIIAIYNLYCWKVSGNQYIKINTSSKIYTNSDLYVSVIAQKNNVDLDTKTKLKLLNSTGKKVKNVDIKYDGNNAILNIPEIEAGSYLLEAKVSSKEGKDTIRKKIYISDGNVENVTITLDKGIYKPGDTINYRALLTNKDNDEPISKDINVSIYDGNDNKVYNEDVKTSDYGITSGSFTLADEVNSGLYKLVIKTNNNETVKQFKVNPYVTPKYEVKLNYDKKSYLVGEKAKITFEAKYFFGEAVKDATLTTYINDEEYKKIKTDSQGKATVDYEIKEANTYNVKVEAVDSSNYFVEATSSFTAGNDIFEVQLIPEYETLVSGQKNDIYVFTNKIDGTPLKTYVTISSNNFTKQIATDENGVGKFSIDINEIPSNNYNYNYNSTTKQKNTKLFTIKAQKTNGESVTKNISLDINKKNIVLSTNKVKYEQGEDIKVNVFSMNENNKNIYFFKNDKLIKMIDTEYSDATVNLGDIYGLIDIYVTESIGTGNNSTVNLKDSSIYKKTIFVKPTKKLNINVNTDKQEYKPGEKISISFDTTDENNTGIDAALLVSMLDNSVLNLANNDLSIDNIKLALQNIKFSNDLDAATLYSCIIDDSSEQTMMALLLKQKDENANISETGMYNDEQKEKSIIISIISLLIIAITILIVLCIKNKKFKDIMKIIMKHIFNFIIYDFLLVIISFGIIEEYFTHVDYSWWTFGITSIIGIVTYILVISKLNEKIYKTSISIIITIFIVLLLRLLINYMEIQIRTIALIIALALLIIVVLAKISEAKKLKINKYMQKIMKELIYILSFIVAVIISIFIGTTLLALMDMLDILNYNFLEIISTIIAIISLYYLNYLFNNLGKVKDRKIAKEKEQKTKKIVLSIFAIIGIITVGYIIINQLEDSTLRGPTRYDAPTPQNRGVSPNSFAPDAERSQYSGSSNNDIPLFESMEDLFTSKKDETNSLKQEETSTEEEKTQITTDNKIRNVFLESMCFIPELITTNGQTKVDLDLSDNITTWTIQTVGNTKDGRIGYGILDNVKVFKEFFVDFELPKNLVETDNVSIPITVHNYTDNQISTNIKIQDEDWFKLKKDNNIKVKVNAKSTKMVYVPITVLKAGDNKFRAEISSNSLTDIVEKECNVSPYGYKVEKVVSTGNLSEDISEDILILEDIVQNTAKAKVKIYSSTMSQTVEGMENIFRMPTGCFEQISSSLYPNILALKYLQDNGIINEEIKTKANSYISSGYQKLLTYEVDKEEGGYSLYGHSPAETVLTAYGLMEVTDLSKVYSVDNSVIEKMTEFLYKKQQQDGTFTITGSHIGGANSRDTLSLNAYITWALSESNPKDGRLNKSVDYLKNKLDSIDDNYTLALIANILANVEDKELNDVLKRLVNNVNIDENSAYITSNVVDYYGSRSNVQTIQTVALTSMALSKGSYNQEKNKLLINYLISKKDTRGTWTTTQATILALKALNEQNEKNKLENQTITVKINEEEQKIEIQDNPLELYELTFENLNKENKLSIDIEKGDAYYEVVEEYYVPYKNVNNNNGIEISVESNNNLKVNEILKSNIKAINRSDNNILNGMITISIPQGFTVIEESLMQLENKGIIEKYEISYTEVNIYLRNFEVGQITNLSVWFRASYPVSITGMSIRAYDYYNPELEGKTMPIKINVKQ